MSGAKLRQAMSLALLLTSAAAAADPAPPPAIAPTSLPPGLYNRPQDEFREQETEPDVAIMTYVFSCLTEVVDQHYGLAERDCGAAGEVSPSSIWPGSPPAAPISRRHGRSTPVWTRSSPRWVSRAKASRCPPEHRDRSKAIRKAHVHPHPNLPRALSRCGTRLTIFGRCRSSLTRVNVI